MGMLSIACSHSQRHARRVVPLSQRSTISLIIQGLRESRVRGCASDDLLAVLASRHESEFAALLRHPDDNIRRIARWYYLHLA